MLFKSGRYKGNPFAAHINKGIHSEHFDRWLELFDETPQDCFPFSEAVLLIERAEQITESLKAGLFFRPDWLARP